MFERSGIRSKNYLSFSNLAAGRSIRAETLTVSENEVRRKFISLSEKNTG